MRHAIIIYNIKSSMTPTKGDFKGDNVAPSFVGDRDAWHTPNKPMQMSFLIGEMVHETLVQHWNDKTKTNLYQSFAHNFYMGPARGEITK